MAATRNQYTHGMKMPRSVASNLLFSETELPRRFPCPLKLCWLAVDWVWHGEDIWYSAKQDSRKRVVSGRWCFTVVLEPSRRNWRRCHQTSDLSWVGFSTAPIGFLQKTWPTITPPAQSPVLAFNQFTSSACLTLGSSFHLKWSYRDEFYFHISSTTSWNYSLLSGPEVNTAMQVKKSMACVLYWKLNV